MQTFDKIVTVICQECYLVTKISDVKRAVVSYSTQKPAQERTVGSFLSLQDNEVIHLPRITVIRNRIMWAFATSYFRLTCVRFTAVAHGYQPLCPLHVYKLKLSIRP